MSLINLWTCVQTFSTDAAVGLLYRRWAVYRGGAGEVVCLPQQELHSSLAACRDMVVNVVAMIAAPPTW